MPRFPGPLPKSLFREGPWERAEKRLGVQATVEVSPQEIVACDWTVAVILPLPHKNPGKPCDLDFLGFCVVKFCIVKSAAMIKCPPKSQSLDENKQCTCTSSALFSSQHLINKRSLPFKSVRTVPRDGGGCVVLLTFSNKRPELMNKARGTCGTGARMGTMFGKSAKRAKLSEVMPCS